MALGSPTDFLSRTLYHGFDSMDLNLQYTANFKLYCKIGENFWGFSLAVDIHLRADFTQI